FFISKFTWEESINNLKKILEEYKNSISVDLIGFPKNWEEILK
ncbi:unnamed protein product, partial [marine sediment metagenome]